MAFREFLLLLFLVWPVWTKQKGKPDFYSFLDDFQEKRIFLIDPEEFLEGIPVKIAYENYEDIIETPSKEIVLRLRDEGPELKNLQAFIANEAKSKRKTNPSLVQSEEELESSSSSGSPFAKKMVDDLLQLRDGTDCPFCKKRFTNAKVFSHIHYARSHLGPRVFGDNFSNESLKEVTALTHSFFDSTDLLYKMCKFALEQEKVEKSSRKCEQFVSQNRDNHKANFIFILSKVFLCLFIIFALVFLIFSAIDKYSTP